VVEYYRGRGSGDAASRKLPTSVSKTLKKIREVIFGKLRIGINYGYRCFNRIHCTTGQWEPFIVIVYLLSHKDVITTIYILLFLEHLFNFCCWISYRANCLGCLHGSYIYATAYCRLTDI